MFEGVPYILVIVDFKLLKYKSLFFIRTAIRTLEAQGDEYVKPYNLSSLRVLGTVGEPINYDAWVWYNEKIGGKTANIVDTWWQTETGGIMISNLAGISRSKPTYATFPLPGIQPCIMDENGNEITSNNAEGSLCIKYPWPQ